VLLEAHIEEGSALAHLRRLRTELGQLTDLDRKQYDKLRRRATRRAVTAADVVVCTCSATYTTIMAGTRFNNVVIDEAGQAIEPEALGPIVHGAQRVALVGDTKQLGPVVKCARAENGGLGVSLFARLESCKTPFTMLNVQFRMHPSISAFPSMQFYDGALLDAESTTDRLRPDVTFPWPHPNSPSFFLHVAGAEAQNNRGSYANAVEAAAVAACVRRLIGGGAEPREVGVIAMYDGQRGLISSLLSATGDTVDVRVATADSFQGQELPFIILSLTRANAKGKVGFVSKPNRMNVALTRAQSGLIVVGDAVTLAVGSSIWSAYIHRLSSMKDVVTGPFTATSGVNEGALDALVEFTGLPSAATARSVQFSDFLAGETRGFENPTMGPTG